MVKANMKIRTALLESGIRFYEVAQKMGYSESYFSRLMRTEFSDADRDRVLAAIRDLRSERGVTDVCNG